MTAGPPVRHRARRPRYHGGVATTPDPGPTARPSGRRRASGARPPRLLPPVEPSWAAAVAAVVVRPTLWVTAMRQVVLLAQPSWWRRSPRVPAPDPGYLHFRAVTAYGGGQEDVPLRVDDLITYLRWCRAWPRVAR